MPRLPTVLVVDDDRLCRQTTKLQLAASGYEAECVAGPGLALDRLEAHAVDIVLTDLRMPGMDGISFLRELRRLRPDLDVVLMTAHATVESAVQAMQEGAADYLVKPIRFPELDLRLRRILEARWNRNELRRLTQLVEATSEWGIIGRSDPMIEVLRKVRLFSDLSAPILITGETGTGKEIVARALHGLASRKHGSFVAVACGAIPAGLAESYFLGHEKGAFTGASQRRKGVFEQASGGTLLLDDVDDLPTDLQVMLLRVVQEGLVTRVGGSVELPVDVRLIATSKVDLATVLQAGLFRDDLYYRLRGLEIVLPPLRERADDVVLLAQHFLRVVASSCDRPPCTLSADAVEALRSWSWPGNVRELRRTMETADALAMGGEITTAHMPRVGVAKAKPSRKYSLHLNPDEPLDLDAILRDFEDEIIAWALDASDGRQTVAAQLLGVPRTTLQSKLGRVKPVD